MVFGVSVFKHIRLFCSQIFAHHDQIKTNEHGLTPGFSPLEVGIVLIANGVSLHTAFHYHQDMTEILL